jgi:hypothetical protein
VVRQVGAKENPLPNLTLEAGAVDFEMRPLERDILLLLNAVTLAVIS